MLPVLTQDVSNVFHCKILVLTTPFCLRIYGQFWLNYIIYMCTVTILQTLDIMIITGLKHDSMYLYTL
jgi:hypothetical protein